MDASGTNQEFFYNLIPGAIFSLSLYWFFYASTCTINKDNAILLIVLLVVSGLFFGFLFQGITRFLRGSLLFDSGIYSEIMDEAKPDYDRAVEILKDKKIINREKNREDIDKDIRHNLHLMDNYLRINHFKSTTEHFSAKSAFWSNILLVSFILIFYSYLKLPDPHSWIKLFFLFLMIASFYFSRIYYKSQYDVVIKSFLTVVQIDKQEKRSRKIRPSAQ